VVIKIEREDGDNVQIFDNNHYFKVVRWVIYKEILQQTE
jgi:hypothetical protein